MKYDKKDVTTFLRESNAIENVWDDDSLQQALYAWEYLVTEPKLTTTVVLKTHKILMLHQPMMPAERGYFRMPDTRPGFNGQVYIAGRESKPWKEVPKLIQNWCMVSNVAVERKNKDIEDEIQQLHVGYEEIHPFIDGNGRTGRMFMNYQRLKAGLPILIIYEKDKWEYYKWFNNSK